MLRNQRLRMNLRLAFGGFFIGILTASLVWSFQGVRESREQAALGMPGGVTVLYTFEGPWVIAAADAAAAREELKTYVRERSLALVISSTGDGRPEILVHDPHGLVSWFPRVAPEDLNSAVSEVYLLKGTYSERRWSESAATPLLPSGVVVAGVISIPPDAGLLLDRVQYARRVGREPLPPGRYAVNTTDETQVRHVLSLLRRMGLAIAGRFEAPPPTVGNVILEGSVAFALVVLLSGHGCIALYWSLYLRERAGEFGAGGRRARLRGLVREYLVGGLPGLAAGAVLGVFLAGLMVAVVGRAPLSAGNLQMLAGVAVAAVISVMATWSTTLYVGSAPGAAGR
ncbi:MAG TPA: hypothetical protein VLK32_02460 [Bacillota bacterium]|nr:hypothetical protein [Bacillota bacterium]